MIGLLFACAGEPEALDSQVDVEPPRLEPLAAPRLLRRLSLDLRGVLPSVEELDAVEADPSLVETTRDAYLEDPLFEERLVRLLNERWHTRQEVYDVEYYDFGLPWSEEFEFEKSIAEEPLRLAARVVVEDEPWTEIVQADWTLGNEVLGEIWPMDYPAGGEGWELVTWTDGRPRAGLLSSNGLWWRYTSTPFNQNRTRTAALFRILVCEDYLERPVEVSAATLESEDLVPTSLIKTDPACQSCHSTIEPVAASLYGFYWTTQYSAAEMVVYHPERELLGPDELEVDRAWFGTPVSGLEELGAQIAQDPRFHACAVETWTELLLRRDTELDDRALLGELRGAYADGGRTIRPLLRAITSDPAYTAGAAEEPRHLTARTLTPDQLMSTLNDLSGFEWIWQTRDQLDNDTSGYRIMAGGVDGVYVAAPVHDPTVGWSLTMQRSAELAAGQWVQTGAFDDAEVRGTLEALYWRLYAERPGEAWVDDAEALWTEVGDADGEDAAWAAVVSAMIRSPRMVSY